MMNKQGTDITGTWESYRAPMNEAATSSTPAVDKSMYHDETFVQPIASVHDALGRMCAVRVALVTVSTATGIRAHKKLWLPSKYDYLCVAEVKRVEVKHVSFIDMSADKELRSMLWGESCTIHGTGSMSRVLADGMVLDPEIYQYVGTIRGRGAVRYDATYAERYYLDYAGNLYTVEQVLQRTPAIESIIRYYVMGTKNLTSVNQLLNIGNVVFDRRSILGVGNIADGAYQSVSVLTAECIIDKYKREALNVKAAAATLMTNNKDIFIEPNICSHYTGHSFGFYSIAINLETVTSAYYSTPAGYAVVKLKRDSTGTPITAATLLPRNINIGRGAAEVEVAMDLLPQLTCDDYVACLRAVASDIAYPIVLPKIASVPGTCVGATLKLTLTQPYYRDIMLDLSENVYDLVWQRLYFEQQPVHALRVSDAYQQDISVRVTQPEFLLEIVPTKLKYLPSVQAGVMQRSKRKMAIYLYYDKNSYAKVCMNLVKATCTQLELRYTETNASDDSDAHAHVVLPAGVAGKLKLNIEGNMVVQEHYYCNSSVNRVDYTVKSSDCKITRASQFLTHVQNFAVNDIGKVDTDDEPKHIYLCAGVDNIYLRVYAHIFACRYGARYMADTIRFHYVLHLPKAQQTAGVQLHLIGVSDDGCEERDMNMECITANNRLIKFDV